MLRVAGKRLSSFLPRTPPSSSTVFLIRNAINGSDSPSGFSRFIYPSRSFSIGGKFGCLLNITGSDEKKVEYSLQNIHGIGRTRAKQILCNLTMENKVTKDLSEKELITLREEVSKYITEGELRRFDALSIKRLEEIKCYRGFRHIQGLSCRGQRTKTNCRTMKGKRIAIAGKKKSPR